MKTLERTVTETSSGWLVRLRLADHLDFETAAFAIDIHMTTDAMDQHPIYREVLRVALRRAREAIDEEIEALRVPRSNAQIVDASDLIVGRDAKGKDRD